MEHLVKFGVQGFRSAITLFPDWAAYVIGQCREHGYDQQKALPELKQLYAQILANPTAYGVPTSTIKRESPLSEVRYFDLGNLPLFDNGFFNEMVNTLLSLCVTKEGRPHYMTIHNAQTQLLDAFSYDFHAEIKSCVKSVYAALLYHPSAKRFFVSSIAEVDAYNPFAPHHFTEDDKAILWWLQTLLCKLESMDEYKAIDYSFEGYSGRLRAYIDCLLDGSLDSECSFQLSISDNDGLDNYSLSLRFDADVFEFHLSASGIDNADECYSESVLYWSVDTECKVDADAAKIAMLPEYEFWFVTLNPEVRVTASFVIDDCEPYVCSNRPKQLDFIRLEEKEKN